jgi:hypothetical protein
MGDIFLTIVTIISSFFAMCAGCELYYKDFSSVSEFIALEIYIVLFVLQIAVAVSAAGDAARKGQWC